MSLHLTINFFPPWNKNGNCDFRLFSSHNFEFISNSSDFSSENCKLTSQNSFLFLFLLRIAILNLYLTILSSERKKNLNYEKKSELWDKKLQLLFIYSGAGTGFHRLFCFVDLDSLTIHQRLIFCVQRTKVSQSWNDMAVSKWWQDFTFEVKMYLCSG